MTVMMQWRLTNIPQTPPQVGMEDSAPALLEAQPVQLETRDGGVMKGMRDSEIPAIMTGIVGLPLELQMALQWNERLQQIAQKTA